MIIHILCRKNNISFYKTIYFIIIIFYRLRRFLNSVLKCRCDILNTQLDIKILKNNVFLINYYNNSCVNIDVITELLFCIFPTTGWELTQNYDISNIITYSHLYFYVDPFFSNNSFSIINYYYRQIKIIYYSFSTIILFYVNESYYALCT